MNLKLYGYWRSSASWRVRWALELKQLQYASIPVNLKTGEQKKEEYLKKTASGRVPLLELEDGTKISQSLAIISYLDSLPEGNGYILFPKEPKLLARALELWELIAADTHPLQNLSTQQRHSSEESERLEWTRHFIVRGLTNFETLLDSSKKMQSFCLANLPTLPDLALVPQVYNGLRFGVDIQKLFPKIWSIYNFALSTPECLRASPEKQSDYQV